VEKLTIVQVSPYPLEDDSEVGSYVRSLSAELAALGHRVLVAVPSRDDRAVRKGRRAITTEGELGAFGSVTVLAVAEALGAPGNGTRAAVPIDVTRTMETLLSRPDIDICHVHEPFAPSLPSVALRHSRALNVGTFHAPTERIVATQVARKLVSLIFGRLDARQATTGTTAALMERYFPAEYETVPAGTETVRKRANSGETHTIAFIDHEERQALRVVLRALRRLPEELPWQANIVSATGPSTSTPLRASLRDRVSFSSPETAADVLADADIVVCASLGQTPRPAHVASIAASGAIPVISDLDAYEEIIDGCGLSFAPGDAETLAAQLQRLLTDEKLRDRLSAASPDPRPWSAVAAETEATYRRLLARRHDTTGNPALWKKLQRRPLIDVDLHMHTDHSGDCATPVEHLLATAREQGLGAIAITDHNEVSGAFDAEEKAADYGVKIIIGEEVKTATQGEVIGLFLKEKIPRGMTLEETVAEIKRAGGLVYVPHPFDRMHSVPDYKHLLAIIDDIDAIEIYNPRVAIGAFNEEAERFAAKYRLVRGAGSDSHVAAGLGTVRIRMHDFDGPEEFLESLRHAEIHTKSGTLLYVQALKFLETKATPPAARKARRDRRVRRAQRAR
jgi:predicted metal-dependent phosphoesterase TrpH/glycosyltransferase involved in cell wall biosynthesis